MRFAILPWLLGLLLTSLSARAEFRAAWVPSVYNLAFPSRTGLNADEARAELRTLVTCAKRHGVSALYFQVRPECDALYASSLDPWSSWLTGTQGVDPGYDPLALLCREARAQGVAVHAWINPFRASANASRPRSRTHMSRRFPEATVTYGTSLWMDPGVPAVRAHVLAVVRDLLTRYDLAGIHLDDYFYPYPVNPKRPEAFRDDASYRASGTVLNRADWRRQNVNRLVRDLHALVHATKPGAEFGISPFGVYRDNVPAGIRASLQQYDMLYADPVTWLREGWVDYIVPQLYWKDGGEQSFSTLWRWWRSPAVNPRGIPVYAGVALDRLSAPHNWPLSEIAGQLNLVRSTRGGPPGGVVFWSIKPLQRNVKGVGTLVEP
jgi:uncharacterized lipoprotein YddW (UPF0748 family)